MSSEKGFLMKRAILFPLGVIVPLLVLTGCTEPQMTDATRTKTEGTLVGAAGGAALGALIGDRNGALIGAALGSVAGYAYGSHVAEEKAKYAREEDWLDASIRKAEKANRDIRAYNARLQKKIAERNRLAKLYKQHKISRNSMLAEKRKIDQERAQANKKLQLAQNELKHQQAVINEARKSGSNARVRRLEREKSKMKQEINTLKHNTQTLASQSVLFAV